MQKIALSGVQVTGSLHIGNYLGSIKHWVNMQHDYQCFCFLADLHAITIDRSPEELHSATMQTAAMYLACGIDPKKSTIFAQSSVPEHAELAWILNCVTPLGWLKRMTQFKDKAGKDQEKAGLGLFSYPVLMAADILLYEADFVPVGEDQKQHIEITRDIAGVVNRKFGKGVLKVPEPLIQGSATRIKSLRDGTKKMSKSDSSEFSRIHLSDSSDQIRQKLKKAKSDSTPNISYDPEDRPEIANLIDIYSNFSSEPTDLIIQRYKATGCAKFKEDLAEVIIEALSPIRDKYIELLKDDAYLLEVLNDGKDKAREAASKTLSKVKNLFGFVQI